MQNSCATHAPACQYISPSTVAKRASQSNVRHFFGRTICVGFSLPKTKKNCVYDFFLRWFVWRIIVIYLQQVRPSKIAKLTVWSTLQRENARRAKIRRSFAVGLSESGGGGFVINFVGRETLRGGPNMHTISKERTRRPHPQLYADSKYFTVEVYLILEIMLYAKAKDYYI